MAAAGIGQDLAAQRGAVFIVERLGIAAHQRPLADRPRRGGVDRDGRNGAAIAVKWAGGIGEEEVEIQPQHGRRRAARDAAASSEVISQAQPKAALSPSCMRGEVGVEARAAALEPGEADRAQRLQRLPAILAGEDVLQIMVGRGVEEQGARARRHQPVGDLAGEAGRLDIGALLRAGRCARAGRPARRNAPRRRAFREARGAAAARAARRRVGSSPSSREIRVEPTLPMWKM